MLRLIKLWLKTPVEERDGEGRRRLTGGKKVACGTPQGGVISPLFANLYMNRFLKYWTQMGQAPRLRARVVLYADDFVILSGGHAAEALEWTRGVMARLGLTVNETKTSIKDARRETFDFLGYSFGPTDVGMHGRLASRGEPVEEEHRPTEGASARGASDPTPSGRGRE